MTENKETDAKADSSTQLAKTDSNLPALQDDFPFFGRTPFTMMRRFLDDMDRVFKDFNGFRSPEFETKLESVSWAPKVEISRTDGDLIVKADLPGMKREDINIEISDGLLSLSGERKQESEEKKEGYYRSEVSYGSFFRSIPLPEGAVADSASAHFENGVLEIKVAVPAVQPNTRKVEIAAGTEEEPAKTATAKP